MFLVNSRYPRFSATPVRSWSKSNHVKGPAFSRSYGCILPSSLARVLSSALGCSPCLPVSVCGTDNHVAQTRDFSWKHGINQFAEPSSSSSRLGVTDRCSSPYGSTDPPYLLEPPNRSEADLPFFVLPASTPHSWCRNINLLSIAYALRPRLRVRLTLGGVALPRNP